MTDAVIVDDSIPISGTDDCGFRAVIYPEEGAIPVPLGTLEVRGGDGREPAGWRLPRARAGGPTA